MILVQLAALTVWVQGSEVNLEGIQKAKEDMNKQQAARVSCVALAESSSTGSGGSWMRARQRRLATSQN